MKQNKILKIEDTDLVITYSWGDSNHGICGHLYEVIDYFWILKEHFNIKILMCEINEQTLISAIKSKYNFSEEELNIIITATIFNYKPKIIFCKNILFTDGSVPKISKLVIKSDNKFMFSCSKFELTENMKDFKVLEDQRVYKRNKCCLYCSCTRPSKRPICSNYFSTIFQYEF